MKVYSMFCMMNRICREMNTRMSRLDAKKSYSQKEMIQDLIKEEANLEYLLEQIRELKTMEV